MSDPRFSVIIPTRERAETLPFALRTCTDQDFDDFEVIVHDNCSSPATREAVLQNKSDKVRYIRSDEPLAMTDNWERALSFARGEYVIIIGDDDGLVPHALKTLDPFLRDRAAKLVRWVRASYHWPNHPYPLKRNSLKIPLDNHGYVMPSREIIRKVANMEMIFQALPMLYNSVAHRDLIAEVRAKCGRVFSSLSPDVGSGFALAYIAKEYLSLECPFSLGGISGKSNGLGYTPDVNPDNPGPMVFNDFKTLNKKSGRDLHHRMPKVYCLPTLIGDSFHTVKDKLFPDDGSLDIRRLDLMKNCLKEIRLLPRESALEGVEAIRSNLNGEEQLRKWFELEIARAPIGDPPPPFSTKSPRGYLEREHILGLDPTDFGVTDVHGASQLCDKILNYDRGGFRCEIRDFHASGLQQLRSIGRILLKRGGAELSDCD